MLQEYVGSSEECHCECHYHHTSVHMIACCKECPICGKRIKTAVFESHIKNCQPVALYNLNVGEYWRIDNVKKEMAETIIRNVRCVEKKTRENFAINMRMIPFGQNNKLSIISEKVPKTQEIGVSFNLSYAIKRIAILKKTYDDHNEKILIERKDGEITIISRNDNEYRLGASCDPEMSGELPSPLAVSILSEPMPGCLIIDSGTCWIAAGNPGRVSFYLRNIDQHLAVPGEIADMLGKVKTRVDEIFKGLFESKTWIKN